MSHSVPATLAAAARQEDAPTPRPPKDKWAPTSSKAPPSRTVFRDSPPAQPTTAHAITGDLPASSASAPIADEEHEATLRKSTKPKRGKLPHKGFVLEALVGTMGCLGAVCRRHGAEPGVRAGGFVGGNVKGVVEVGLAGGWGKLRSSGGDSSVLALYGVDPAVVQQAIMDQMDMDEFDLDLGILEAQSSKATATQLGPAFRIHFVPRGRILAFVGTGVSYNRFRAQYATNTGDTRLDLHGMAVPFTAGLGVMPAKNIALGAQLDYLWTRYWVAVLDHPIRRMVTSVSKLEEWAGARAGELQHDMPKLWTVTFALRARF
jgi:hypothetical protein